MLAKVIILNVCARKIPSSHYKQADQNHEATIFRKIELKRSKTTPLDQIYQEIKQITNKRTKSPVSSSINPKILTRSHLLSTFSASSSLIWPPNITGVIPLAGYKSKQI